MSSGDVFWVVGIDPGSRGAIAALRSDLSGHRILNMPMLDKAIDTAAVREFFATLHAISPVRYAVLEKSQVMPNQGAVAGFTYGRNYGVLLTCLEFLGIGFTEVAPAKWKLAVIGPSALVRTPKTKVDHTGGTAPSVDSGKSAQKKAIKELAILTARRMFPAAGPFKKTEDGPAEALLMAEAARRIVLFGSMNGHKAAAT